MKASRIHFTNIQAAHMAVADSEDQPVDNPKSAFIHPAGGVVTGETWTKLAHLARECADGRLYIHYHSTIELRGIRDPDAVITTLEDATGTVAPMALTASPLSVQARELAEYLAEQMDEAAFAAEETIGIDGGTGDVLAARPHVAFQITDPKHVEMAVNGRLTGKTLSTAELTERFAQLVSEAGPTLSRVELPDLSDEQRHLHVPIGWLAEHTEPGTVDLGAGIYQGILPVEIAELFGHADLKTTVTPWRGVVIHGLGEGEADAVLRVLAPRGLLFDINSPHLRK